MSSLGVSAGELSFRWATAVAASGDTRTAPVSYGMALRHTPQAFGEQKKLGSAHGFTRWRRRNSHLSPPRERSPRRAPHSRRQQNCPACHRGDHLRPSSRIRGLPPTHSQEEGAAETRVVDANPLGDSPLARRNSPAERRPRRCEIRGRRPCFGGEAAEETGSVARARSPSELAQTNERARETPSSPPHFVPLGLRPNAKGAAGASSACTCRGGARKTRNGTRDVTQGSVSHWLIKEVRERCARCRSYAPAFALALRSAPKAREQQLS